MIMLERPTVEQSPASDSGASSPQYVRSWESVLHRAIMTPGLIHEAYHRFYAYSLRNQLLAITQCWDRGLAPGPLATYKQWDALGRHVMRGQKAITLCVPITTKRPTDETLAPDDDTVWGRMYFVYRSRWFVLAQTDGQLYEPISTPTWHEERALTALGIRRIPFDHHDGNTQGYATSQREIAINPVAALPHKTLFHETAHLLLEHNKDDKIPHALREVEAEGVALLCCEALNLNGSEYARGYVQHYLKDGQLTTATAQRIITTAQRIINAGTREPDHL